jgi:hypothetical protein
MTARLLIGHEARGQVNSNGGGDHRGSMRRSALAAVLGPAKEAADERGSREAHQSTIKARPHGIKPERESEASSSIPGSLHLPCDVKHALLANSPCPGPGGTEAATLGGKRRPHGVYMSKKTNFGQNKKEWLRNRCGEIK